MADTLETADRRPPGAALPNRPLLDVDGVTLQYKTRDHLVTATYRVSFQVYPADRFVLLLLDGEGWNVRDIAQRIGWTVTNVKVRAFRARRRLRRALRDPS